MIQLQCYGRWQMDRDKASAVIDILQQEYGHMKCGLNYRTPYELLVATILSAQCTDVRVNQITERLFESAKTPEEMVGLGQEDLRKIIRSCGLSESKSANIIKTSQALIDRHGSTVPSDFKALTALYGVGRKTANVVLSNAFGVAAIAVDTHVQRVSNRIGLAHATDVVKTERQLMEIIDKQVWSDAHHWLIWHGRTICSARSPKCDVCPLYELCEYEDKKKH